MASKSHRAAESEVTQISAAGSWQLAAGGATNCICPMRWAIHLPAKEFALRVLGCEAGLLAQQGYGQRVRGDHHQHGNVEGHQGAEDKERAIVDDAHIRMRHNILLVHQACKGMQVDAMNGKWRTEEGEVGRGCAYPVL